MSDIPGTPVNNPSPFPSPTPVMPPTPPPPPPVTPSADLQQAEQKADELLGELDKTQPTGGGQKWGQFLKVGGALLLLLVVGVGIVVGTMVVTNLQNKVNLEKKAQVADECPGLPAFDTVDACTQSCLAGCPLSPFPVECAAGCPAECINLCAGGTPTNTCGNGVCDAPGETETNCPSDCGTSPPSPSSPPSGSGSWNQCTSSTGPIPCGSCSIKSVGAGTMSFGCELNCGGSASNCPGGSAGSYSIEHKWQRCPEKGVNPCVSNFVDSGDLGGPGPWSISGQSLVNGSGTFPNPGCGRVQVDVQMSASGTNVAGDVWDSGVNCGGTPPPSAPPGGPTPTPTPTPTPPAGLACTSLAGSPVTPGLGETVTFTCRAPGTQTVDHFEFRYRVDSGAWTSLAAGTAQSSGGNYLGTSQLTVSQAGAYNAQCRVCQDAAATQCTNWGVDR